MWIATLRTPVSNRVSHTRLLLAWMGMSARFRSLTLPLSAITASSPVPPRLLASRVLAGDQNLLYVAHGRAVVNVLRHPCTAILRSNVKSFGLIYDGKTARL